MSALERTPRCLGTWRGQEGDTSPYIERQDELITPDVASARGSIVNANKIGLLARNIFAALPIPDPGTVGIGWQKLKRYLQLRDSS
jgi:hypothetical protein